MNQINDSQSTSFVLALLTIGLVCVSCDSGDNRTRAGQPAVPDAATTLARAVAP